MARVPASDTTRKRIESMIAARVTRCPERRDATLWHVVHAADGG